MKLASLCKENGQIDPELYGKYEVKRGLRDISGKGVLTGLTEILSSFFNKVCIAFARSSSDNSLNFFTFSSGGFS